MKHLALQLLWPFAMATAIILRDKIVQAIDYWATNPTLYTKEFGNLPLVILVTVLSVLYAKWKTNYDAGKNRKDSNGSLPDR